MTQDDLNQIRGVVKEEVTTALEPVTKKLDALWDQTVKLTEDMIETQETLTTHTTSLKVIMANTESNKDDISKLNKRASNLEDRAGIVPSPELTIIR